MKKKEFIEELDKILAQKSYPDKDDVIKDFEEHFRIGEEEGKSEEEIAKLLGTPKDIAEQFKEEEIENTKKGVIEVKTETIEENKEVKKENNNTTKIILAICLIFFNVVVVLGIAGGVFGALLGFFAAFIAVTVAGVALLVVGILGLILGTVILPTYLMSLILLFSGIGTIALGILGTMIMTWITIQVVKLFIKYCTWNVKVVKGGI